MRYTLRTTTVRHPTHDHGAALASVSPRRAVRGTAGTGQPPGERVEHVAQRRLAREGLALEGRDGRWTCHASSKWPGTTALMWRGPPAVASASCLLQRARVEGQQHFCSADACNGLPAPKRATAAAAGVVVHNPPQGTAGLRGPPAAAASGLRHSSVKQADQDGSRGQWWPEVARLRGCRGWRARRRSPQSCAAAPSRRGTAPACQRRQPGGPAGTTAGRRGRAGWGTASQRPAC